MPKKRRFGRVRKLASGRFQARYHGPDGRDRPAPHTFASKRMWNVGSRESRQTSSREAGATPTSAEFRWESSLTPGSPHRTGLRIKTIELYRWLEKRCLRPYLYDRNLGDVTPSHIRAWQARLLADGVSATTAAKAYRLLRAVFNTAVDDELIRRSPCRIKGGGAEPVSERPTATVAQVYDLAERVPPRCRALILMAAITGLRYGELAALRRRHLDIQTGTVTVLSTLVEPKAASASFGQPKSAAGRRVVTVPAAIRDEILRHLDTYVSTEEEELVFTSRNGSLLRRSNFQRATNWTETVRAVGLVGFHFHDLRHTGNTIAADTGACLRTLMTRMGQGSTRAALIYQHTTRQHDETIADEMSKRIEREADRARNGHATED